MTPVLKMRSETVYIKTVFIITSKRKVTGTKFLQINDQFDRPSSKNIKFFQIWKFSIFSKTSIFWEKSTRGSKTSASFWTILTQKTTYYLPSLFPSIFISFPIPFLFLPSSFLSFLSFQQYFILIFILNFVKHTVLLY